LSKQIVQVDWRAIHIRPIPIALAALCLLAVPPVQLLSYRTLLGAYAQAPPLRVMAAVAWIPPLGKYVPGKVASLAGAVYLLRKFQIPAAIALGVVLVMDGLAVVSGLITGSPLLLWDPVRRIIPNGWIWCAVLVTVGIVCLHPAIFGRLLNLALRRLKRPPLERMPDLGHYLVPVLCAFAQWILAGAALWFIANSVANVDAGRLPLFVAIAGLGYTVSYLMLFAPGGLGPREAIFHATLSLLISPGFSAISVVMMRLVQTLTELTAALVGVIMLRQIEKEQARDHQASAPSPSA
jgi:glycosyltransferase 2 family protein